MSAIEDLDLWQNQEFDKIHDKVFSFVQRVENDQSLTFDRFVKLEALYDPFGPDAGDSGEQLAHVQENVIASNVDAITAAISTSQIRARFMTDGADWKTQRRARHLEWYSEDVSKTYQVLQRCSAAFKEGAKKGNGLVKVHAPLGKIKVERVLVENIVVDDAECRDGKAPMQLHQWDLVDVGELALEFPDYKDEIIAARSHRHSWRQRTRSLIDNRVEMLEGWLLPIGVKGQKGYRAGIHYKAINGCTLMAEKWEDDQFPFAILVWSERISSWYGISGAERIAGIQRALNKRNWQIEKQLDRGAVPVTYMRPVDMAAVAKTSRIGAQVPIKGDWPQTVAPMAVSPETHQSRIDLRDAANNEFGQSQMATHATKPAGIDSGTALREYKDQSSQRFAKQEAAFEQLVIDTISLLISVCKKLGKNAPSAQRRTRFGTKTLRWKDVDMKEVRVQIAPASTLGRTPSGRIQFVLELAQAGIISTDSTRRMLKHPDIEGELSLYTAALESCERCLDAIADGHVVTPEPFQNLDTIVWRGQMELLKWMDDDAPEEILESLREFVVNAAWMLSQKEAANANMADPGAAAPDSGMPALPGGAPAAAQPAAALAPEAMQLRAS